MLDCAWANACKCQLNFWDFFRKILLDGSCKITHSQFDEYSSSETGLRSTSLLSTGARLIGEVFDRVMSLFPTRLLRGKALFLEVFREVPQ